MYEIRFTKEALKDVKKLTQKLQDKLQHILINVIAVNPYSGKKLVGDLSGFYSLRLTYQDRIVYTIEENPKIVYIHRTRTHYEQ